MTKAIYFDMDGTIANLYGVENWLEHLINEHTKPYREAKAMVNMRALGRELNRLKTEGYVVGVVSWLSKCGTEDYDAKVTKAKREWLAKHLSVVEWDEIHIVKYGTPKHEVAKHPNGMLFDDEIGNRENWVGKAYDVNNIIEVLRGLR